MNFTPSSPVYEDMRDGLLAGAAPERRCLIWQGFAATGIGVGSAAKVKGKRVTIAESFAVPAECTAP